MDMALMIDTIQATPDCRVYSPTGLPVVAAEHILPDDLQAFYQICGGVTLFEHAHFAFSIVSPQNLVLANPVLFADVSPEQLAATRGHISWSWYISIRFLLLDHVWS